GKRWTANHEIEARAFIVDRALFGAERARERPAGPSAQDVPIGRGFDTELKLQARRVFYLEFQGFKLARSIAFGKGKARRKRPGSGLRGEIDAGDKRIEFQSQRITENEPLAAKSALGTVDVVRHFGPVIVINFEAVKESATDF